MKSVSAYFTCVFDSPNSIINVVDAPSKRQTCRKNFDDKGFDACSRRFPCQMNF